MTFKIQLQQVQQGDDPTRSPLLFIHGFPDSPLMWRDYLTPAERGQPWLAGRSLYTLAFPNRHTNPDIAPSWLALDHIASTRAFEDEVQRRPDCRFIELLEANHWFPEQQSQLVIAELRRFLA